MKKSFVIILFAFFTFTLWPKPVYIEVEPDVFKWLELYSTSYYDKYGYNTKYESDGYYIEYFYEYDANGNIISEYASNSPEKVYKYEYKDNLIIKSLNSDGSYSLYSYDDNNNLIRLEYVDPNNEDECETEYYEYDKFNNNIHVYDSNDDYEIWYEYDKNNNTTRRMTTDSSQPTLYSYDEFNRLVRVDSRNEIDYYQYDDAYNIETFTSLDKETGEKFITETHYNDNHDATYEKFTSEYGISESWYINEYYEDGKTLKKVSEYHRAF